MDASLGSSFDRASSEVITGGGSIGAGGVYSHSFGALESPASG